MVFFFDFLIFFVFLLRLQGRMEVGGVGSGRGWEGGHRGAWSLASRSFSGGHILRFLSWNKPDCDFFPSIIIIVIIIMIRIHLHFMSFHRLTIKSKTDLGEKSEEKKTKCFPPLSVEKSFGHGSTHRPNMVPRCFPIVRTTILSLHITQHFCVVFV